MRDETDNKMEETYGNELLKIRMKTNEKLTFLWMDRRITLWWNSSLIYFLIITNDLRRTSTCWKL